MTDLPELPKASIRYFLTVPTAAQLSGWHLIRLPRCAVCFDETHDYKNGHASCIQICGHYLAMNPEQRGRWEFATSEDARTKPMTREQP